MLKCEARDDECLAQELRMNGADHSHIGNVDTACPMSGRDLSLVCAASGHSFATVTSSTSRP